MSGKPRDRAHCGSRDQVPVAARRLRVSLDRSVAVREGRGYARVLLAATASWLLVGVWLEVAFFRLAVGLGVDAASLGLKEAVSGLCNATLGFLLFAALRAVRSRYESGNHVAEAPSRTDIEDLVIYRPRRDAAVIAKDGESYLVATFPLSREVTDAGHASVSVAQPLCVLVNELDYRLIIPAFLVMLGFLVVGAIVSSVVETVSERRVQAEQRDLEQKLKTSLNAAALAHEINQPLSRLLLRARLGLETAKGADHDTLAAPVSDAEHVVSIIQKMKVLLRNVETVQSPSSASRSRRSAAPARVA